MSNKEGTFDMGNVSDEDPVKNLGKEVAPAKEPRAKRSKKAEGALSDSAEAKEPKEPKVPTVGDYGKRGLPSYDVTLIEGVPFEGDAAKHHQRVIIYNLLAENNGSMDVADIVQGIENRAELLNAMNTNQSVLRCVSYQVNELVKHGILKTSKEEEKAARAAAKAEKEAAKAAAKAEKEAEKEAETA